MFIVASSDCSVHKTLRKHQYYLSSFFENNKRLSFKCDIQDFVNVKHKGKSKSKAQKSIYKPED